VHLETSTPKVWVSLLFKLNVNMQRQLFSFFYNWAIIANFRVILLNILCNTTIVLATTTLQKAGSAFVLNVQVRSKKRDARNHYPLTLLPLKVLVPCGKCSWYKIVRMIFCRDWRSPTSQNPKSIAS
jgi:hypothetical protein